MYKIFVYFIVFNYVIAFIFNIDQICVYYYMRITINELISV